MDETTSDKQTLHKIIRDEFCTDILPKDDVERARCFMERYGCLNEVYNDNNDTPLLITAWKGKPNILKYLLFAGADTSARNGYGNDWVTLIKTSGLITERKRTECMRIVEEYRTRRKEEIKKNLLRIYEEVLND